MQVSFSKKDICTGHTMLHTILKSVNSALENQDEKSHGTWESISVSYPSYLWKMVSMQHSYLSHAVGLTTQTVNTALNVYDSTIERTMKSLGVSEPHRYTTGHLTQQMLSDTLRLASRNHDLLMGGHLKRSQTPTTTRFL